MVYLCKLAKRLSLAARWSHAVALFAAAACTEPVEREFMGPNPSQPSVVTQITVSPKVGSVRPGEVIQFLATARNAQGKVVTAPVTWTASGGVIGADGVFTASSQGAYRVSAALQSNSAISDSATVAVYLSPTDILKLDVTPNGQEVTVGDGLQLEAVAELANGNIVRQPALEWTAQSGQVDGSGYFVAPGTEGDYLVQAKASSGIMGAATVKVRPSRRLLERLEVTPGTASLQAGQIRQFTATGIYSDGLTGDVSTSWSATGGTISGTGTYTAGSTPGNYRVIARLKQGTIADTSFVSITEPTIVGLTVSPETTGLVTGATQQYQATARMSDGSTRSVGAAWRATGGTISSSGLYKAGTVTGDFAVVGEVVGTSFIDTTAVRVSTPVATLTSVVLDPPSITLPAGRSQQFAVSGTWSDGSSQTPVVTWSATGGSVSSSGNYTAGTTQGTYRVIATATTGQADTSIVTITPATLNELQISPATVSVTPGGTAQFTASGTWSDGTTGAVSVLWSSTGGTFTTSGLFTAGTAEGTYQVIGLHDSGVADTAFVTVAGLAPVLVSISLTPPTATVAPGGALQFSVTGSWNNSTTAAPQVTYTAEAGTITAGGLYTAGSQTGTFRVIARQTGGTIADTSFVTTSTSAPTLQSLAVSPDGTTLQAGGSRQFSVSGTWSDGSSGVPAVQWTTNGGSISSAGLYIAPTTMGTYRVIARELGGTLADTVLVTTSSTLTIVSVAVTPGQQTLTPGQAQQYIATATYSNGGTGTPSSSWSASGGTVSPSGLYTAGATGGTFSVTARPTGASVEGTAGVTVNGPQVTSLVLSPGTASVSTGGTVQFSTTANWSDAQSRSVTLAYSATGGTISASGYFTAPAQAGTVLVMVACASGMCDAVDTTTVVVQQQVTQDPDYPNRPASISTTIGEISFTARTPSTSVNEAVGPTTGVQAGKWWFYGTDLDDVNDPSAPKSPGTVLQFKFGSGLQGGYSPTASFGGWAVSTAPQQYSEYYESAWFKIPSADFETQLVGVKLWGYWGHGQTNDNPTQLYMVMEGNGTTTSVMNNWRIWFGQQATFASRAMYQNRNTTKRLVANVWQRYEMYTRVNDIGVANGVFRVWLDGVLILEYTDVVWRDASNPRGFWGRKWDAVWGGSGGTPKTRNDYLWIDHLYMAGKPM